MRNWNQKRTDLDTENAEEVMIFGGAQIYNLALKENLANRIYLTRVNQSPEGDAFFPPLGDEWKETEIEDHDGFNFVTLEKS